MGKKLVVLEADALGDDISWDRLRDFGELETCQNLVQDQVKEIIKDKDIIISNKLLINEDVLSNSKVKLVCEAATGYNNVDIEYCKKNNIRVTNVSGYSTSSVVQHTFALALSLLDKLSFYNDYVKSKKYSRGANFCYIGNYFHELEGMTWGIIGLGAIGKKVAKIAEAFGAKVIYYSASGNDYNVKYKRVSLEEILKESHILSIHCPLNEKTDNLISYKELKMMKKEAILINVARGQIVNDEALAQALIKNEIGAAGIDVFWPEPIKEDNPLLEIKDNDRLLLTPHTAWGTVEARHRLVDEIYLNIESYLKGEKRSIIV